MLERSPDGVRLERTNWRCQEVSERHRKWGFNCPAVDLDFLVVEYNIGKPVALIEYKHHQARMPELKHPTYAAIADLANGYMDQPLPFLLCFYWPNDWVFRAHPMNTAARKWFRVGEVVSEFEYVQRLYKMRSLVLASNVSGDLIREVPAHVHEAATIKSVRPGANMDGQA